MTDRAQLSAGSSPRLLDRRAAAAYCGVSPGSFETHVPVPAIRVGRRRLWDIRALDRWIDSVFNSVQPQASAKAWLEALDAGDSGARR